MSRRRRMVVVEIWKCLTLEWMSHDALKAADHVIVFRGDQGERVTGALGASSAADTVDVGVGSIGHIVVDDVRDAVDIQAAGGDVGGDHNAEVSGLEAVQSLLTLSLSAVAVQAGDTEARVRDLPGNLVGAVFGAGEDEYRIGVDLFEQFQQQ